MDDNALIDMGALFDAAPTAQIVLTADLRIVTANRRYCALTGRRAEDLVGKGAFDVFPANPDDPDADVEATLQNSVAKVIKTGRADEMPLQQHDIQDADGRYGVRYWRLISLPVFADKSAPDAATHALVSVEDVTKNVLGGRVGEAERRAAMRSADVTYFEFDPGAGTLVRTPQLDAMFGIAENELSGLMQPFLERIHPDDLPAMRNEIQRVGRTIGSDLHHDYRVIWPDGTVRWLVGRGESLRDPDTQSVRIVGVLLDVTDIKKDEARLRAAVEARDLLIAEVNHRVKNSLQMVMSVLRLEAQQTGDETAGESLRAATARVQAVAAIHASLYEDGDVTSVRLDTYLNRLSEHLHTALSSADKKIRIVLDAEPIRLPTDRAVTLSLAVNELVTNSFKHAFGSDGEGTVTVRLRRNGGNTIVLEVSDDGTDTAIDPFDRTSRSSGLGQRLIAGMAAQLNGTVEEERSNGWWTRIVFSE